jgi:hypothetical protein
VETGIVKEAYEDGDEEPDREVVMVRLGGGAGEEGEEEEAAECYAEDKEVV